MKKILLVSALFLALVPAGRAQFLNYGFRAGTGMAVYVDDISFNSPIMAFNLGGFVNFGFTGGQSLVSENFLLQSGLNIVCRGSNFRDVLEKGLSLSLDEGYYRAWYVQLPILATIRYELLIRDPGHYILFQVGPAFSFGVIGQYHERKISPYMPQRTWNYEDNGDAFNNDHHPLNRFDIGAILGVGYERHDLSVMLHLDYGFMAVTKDPDILKQGTDENSKAFVPGGNNLALVLSVGYQIPFR